jgi:hypothetical protein
LKSFNILFYAVGLVKLVDEEKKWGGRKLMLQVWTEHSLDCPSALVLSAEIGESIDLYP